MNEVVWRPSPERIADATITRYMAWLRERRGRTFTTYQDLWRWSVSDLPEFWRSIWDYFGVAASAPYTSVLAAHTMPGAVWFPGARLNYARHALARRDDHPALIARSESRATLTVSYAKLAADVAAARARLSRLGVTAGDRVVGYLPNVPETVVALLAAASLGAVWSSCSPEFGRRAVIDRFGQLRPKVLFAVDGYTYGGRRFGRLDDVAGIVAALPSLEATVVVPLLDDPLDRPALPAAMTWAEFLAAPGPAPLEFAEVPFDHPLWVLYSSGTTGLPKGIVHGHGGILLEHLKSLALHQDLGPTDRFFWFTTTGWMMWNYLIGILLLGGTAVLYDGSPGHPDLLSMWKMASETGTTYFGASAAFIQSLMKSGVDLRSAGPLAGLRGVGSTGGPLSPDACAWIAAALGGRVPIGSISGGTDVCTAFVQSAPILPVRAGFLQCLALGADVQSWSPDGVAQIGAVGELVLARPLPSMPVGLWDDPDGVRYRASYFSRFPGVWRHGDWIRIEPDGSSVISGRSDATLNRDGVRMGTAEFYRVVEELPEIADSLIVETGPPDRSSLVLFVVVRAGASLDDSLRSRIATAVRRELSPRHVPDRIISLPEIPKTLNGKKLEVPVKRLLNGEDRAAAVADEALANPRSLDLLLDGYRSG